MESRERYRLEELLEVPEQRPSDRVALAGPFGDRCLAPDRLLRTGPRGAGKQRVLDVCRPGGEDAEARPFSDADGRGQNGDGALATARLVDHDERHERALPRHPPEVLRRGVEDREGAHSLVAEEANV